MRMRRRIRAMRAWKAHIARRFATDPLFAEFLERFAERFLEEQAVLVEIPFTYDAGSGMASLSSPIPTKRTYRQNTSSGEERE